MRSALRSSWSLLLLLAVAPAISGQASRGSAPPAAQPSTAAKSDPKRPLTIAEYARWRSIGSVAISDDGNWVAARARAEQFSVAQMVGAFARLYEEVA